MSIPSVFRDFEQRLAGCREVAGRGVEVAESELVRTGGPQARHVEVLADLGSGRLPAKLLVVLRQLEELEAPHADRREVVEHLGKPARERLRAARGRSGPADSSGPPR